MKVIAITGSIATGKSNIIRVLNERGYEVLSCDDIAIKLSEPGNIIYNNILNYFGEDYLNIDKTINRKK